MFADVAVALAFEDIHVDPSAVEVAGEEFAVVFLRPHAALIDEAAHVGVAAAEFGGFVADTLADIAPFFRAAVPVVVVGGVADVFVGEGIQMRAEHAFVIGAGDAVPEVADHGVRVEKLAVLVPVESPGIRATVTEDLELFGRRMKTPDRAVHRDAVLLRSPGSADPRGRGDAMASVEPAVRTPLQAVDDVVSDRLRVETVEHHDRLTIGDEVAVGIGNEEQLRRTGHPDAAVTDRDRGEAFALVPENGAFVRLPVAVRVLEDGDPVVQLEVPAARVFGEGVTLRDPEAALLVEGDPDRLTHLRLRREDLDAKSLGQFRRLCRFDSSHGRVTGLLGVVGLGEICGVGDTGAQEQEKWHGLPAGRHSAHAFGGAEVD